MSATSGATAPGALARAVGALRARLTPERLVLGLAAPALALVAATLLTSLVLVWSGDSPVAVFRAMIEYGESPDTIAAVLDQATTYYLSAVAVAIGFKMKLFNIGVDGQYRLAAFVAAVVGGNVALPAPLHVALIVFVAVCVGAMWAGIAGLLRVTRGVSEVISTIMLNFIATGLVAYMLAEQFGEPIQGSNNIGTPIIAESGRVGGLPLVPDANSDVFGFIVVAVLVGIGYWVLLNRTRFGFDLRAAGASATAAVASGVNVKRMVVASMALSGAVAGLVGMPQLLGSSYTYALDFPPGLGFTGIAIALLGRNHPVGIAFSALLFAYLDRSAQILDFENVPPEVILIMQGLIVLSVVVAYEVVRRFGLTQQQKKVGEQLAAEAAEGGPDGGPDGGAGGGPGSRPGDGTDGRDGDDGGSPVQEARA